MGSFKEAFAAAKDGSTFKWNGNSYKKEYAKSDAKSDAKPAAKAAPKPAAKAAPKPAVAEAPAPKRRSASEILSGARNAEERRKTEERGTARDTSIGDTFGTYAGKAAKAVTGSDAAQVLVGSLAGRKRAYTEEDFSPETLDQVRNAARQLRTDAKAGKTDIDRGNRGRLKRGFGQLDYAHYGKEHGVNLHTTDQKNAAASSFGRARIDYDAKGNPTKLTDRYGFKNKNRQAQIDRYEKIADTAENATRFTPIPGKVARGVAKAGAVAYDFGRDLLNQGKPARSNPKRKATWDDTKDNFVGNIGTAVMGNDEVPVNVSLKKEDKKAKGGAVKKYASGGSTSGVPRPPKGEKYDAEANDWMAGEMEVEAEKERRKAKPAPKAPPKAYARGGAVRGCGCESRGKTRGMIR